MAQPFDAAIPTPTGAIGPHKACKTCGASIHPLAEICPGCGVRQRTPVSKAALLVLTFFLGGIGAHKFYLGKYWQGALYLLFCWIWIPALIALVEFVIYAFTSEERLNEKYTASGSAVVVVIAAVFLLVFVVGILAAIAIPAYADYTKKARASEGILMATALRTKIAEAFSQRPGDMSCSAQGCTLDGVDLGPTKFVKRLSSARSGLIVIEYDDSLVAAPQNVLTLTPLIDGRPADLSDPAHAGKSLSWMCGKDTQTTVPPRMLPGSCK